MGTILTEYSEEALIASTENNLVTFFKMLRPPDNIGGEFIEEAGYTQSVTNANVALLNSVVGAQLTDDTADAVIETTIARCKARNVPMLWWIGPVTKPDDLGERLTAHGFRPGGTPPAMVLDLSLVNDDEPVPDGLEIIQVDDDETKRIWTKTLVAGFGMPEVWYESMLHGIGNCGQNGYHNYLGLYEGMPVATASVFLGPAVAGIYNITSSETVRRKGIGRAITLAPLKFAKQQGYHFSMLHSSSMGHSVYEKIGYKDCSTILQYVWSPE